MIVDESSHVPVLVNIRWILFVSASVAFTDCRQLQLAFSLENDVFVHDSHAELPIGDEQACTTIRLQAKRAGHVEVKASYNKGGVKMKAKIIVAAFDPLRVGV